MNSLDPEDVPEEEKPKPQTVEQQERHLLAWMSGANKIYEERGYVVR